MQGEADTLNYSYDLSGRLEHVYKNNTLISTYTYDDNGNRLSHITPNGTKTGVYDAQDRMLSYGNATFGYNARGSLTFRVENGDTTFYNYDMMGNLISASLPDGDFIEYLIDGQNRRVGKKVNGILKKQWIYQDQLNPVAELDGNGNLIARFVYGDRGHVPAYMVKAGVVYRFVTDHLGSVRLIVNTQTGEVVQQLTYDEFGNVLQNTNPDFQPFAYAGGLYDRQTQLMRFGMRDYDATTGRWTAKDPIGFKGGSLNVYSYCEYDAINKIDIYGLDEKFTSGEYIFKFFSKDTHFGGSHWHIYARKGGKLIGRVSTKTGKVVSGKVPNTALKILKSSGRIGAIGLALLLDPEKGQSNTLSSYWAQQYLNGQISWDELKNMWEGSAIWEEILKELGHDKYPCD